MHKNEVLLASQHVLIKVTFKPKRTFSNGNKTVTVKGKYTYCSCLVITYNV